MLGRSGKKIILLSSLVFMLFSGNCNIISTQKHVVWEVQGKQKLPQLKNVE